MIKIICVIFSKKIINFICVIYMVYALNSYTHSPLSTPLLPKRTGTSPSLQISCAYSIPSPSSHDGFPPTLVLMRLCLAASSSTRSRPSLSAAPCGLGQPCTDRVAVVSWPSTEASQYAVYSELCSTPIIRQSKAGWTKPDWPFGHGPRGTEKTELGLRILSLHVCPMRVGGLLAPTGQ
jgi:hypothetical protein